jgi:hypothetical protein
VAAWCSDSPRILRVCAFVLCVASFASQGMTCAAGLILGPCGPRLTALAGVGLAGLGNWLIAAQTPDGGAPAWVFLLGLGLVGGGGNALWLASFPLAQVRPEVQFTVRGLARCRRGANGSPLFFLQARCKSLNFTPTTVFLLLHVWVVVCSPSLPPPPHTHTHTR